MVVSVVVILLTLPCCGFIGVKELARALNAAAFAVRDEPVMAAERLRPGMPVVIGDDDELMDEGARRCALLPCISYVCDEAEYTLGAGLAVGDWRDIRDCRRV